MNLGLLIAPFLAGAIYDKIGYDAVFVIILVIIAFDFTLRASIIEKGTVAVWLCETEAEQPAPSHVTDHVDQQGVTSTEHLLGNNGNAIQSKNSRPPEA